MFWMLLPPPNHAERHFSQPAVPPSVHWGNVLLAGWRMFLGLITFPRR